MPFLNIYNDRLVISGCDAHRYTGDCNSTCPLKCKNQTCDVFNGSCIHGCEDPNALTLDCIGILSQFYLLLKLHQIIISKLISVYCREYSFACFTFPYR